MVDNDNILDEILRSCEMTRQFLLKGINDLIRVKWIVNSEPNSARTGQIHSD